MAVESFEDLEVFQRAYKLSLEVHRVSLQMPAHEQHALADQIRRASKSICVVRSQKSGDRSQNRSAFGCARFCSLSSAF